MVSATGVTGLPSDALKETLSNGSASASTVTTLQQLLAPGSTSIRAETARPAAAAPSKTTRGSKVKPPARKPSAKPQIPIHEDAPPVLAPKAKHALATEVVNITLKVLTEASKVQATISSHSGATRKNPAKTPAKSSNALQPRSGNNTPAPLSPSRTKSGDEAGLQEQNDVNEGPSAPLLAAAECGRLAFSFLRSSDALKRDGSSPPPLQLETGMLALSARLVALGMHNLAAKELSAVKRRLEAAVKPPSRAGDNVKLHSKAIGTEKPDTASLLRLDPAVKSCPDTLPLAITHQQLVLRVVAGSRKPSAVAIVADHFCPSNQFTPPKLILHHAEMTGDRVRAPKQLESLAQILLGLCPGLSASSDASALDEGVSPSPEVVFRLQSTALQIRKEWWQLAGHKVNYKDELLEPFSKCLGAFVRRSTSLGVDQGVYQVAQSSMAQLDIVLSSPSESVFSICRTMTAVAGREAKPSDETLWAEKMLDACEGLPYDNARRVACSVKHASTIMTRDSTDPGAVVKAVGQIAGSLQGQLSGNSTDYDFLLIELVRLSRILVQDRELLPQATAAVDTVVLAASFAQRYARSYPGRNDVQVQAIIVSAMRASRSTDDAHKWIGPEAAKVLIRLGSLKAVAGEATTRPLSVAWSISIASLTLGRIIRALQLKAARSGTATADESVVDDALLDPRERSILLEWQLQCAIELAERPKYHSALQKMLSDMLGMLAKLYTISEYPLRRARVAVRVLQLREAYPSLLLPRDLKIWREIPLIDSAALGNDQGLKPFLEDVQASLETIKAFHARRPGLAELRRILMVWQRLLESASSAADLKARLDNVETLAQLLTSIASYLHMQGHISDRLATLRLLRHLSQVANLHMSDKVDVIVELSQQYLELNISERAGAILAQGHRLPDDLLLAPLSKLRLHLAHAEYMLAIDNHEGAKQSLSAAKAHRGQLPPETVSRTDRRAYELVHAQGWLVKSNLCIATGAPQEALAAAKTAVKLMSSAWAAIERSAGHCSSDTMTSSAAADGPLELPDAVAGVASGISKLQLMPKGEEQVSQTNEKGASFWPLVPLMLKALLHLSDMYAHNGMFSEADYYSERAVNAAEDVGSAILASRMRSQRARLLALAGRFEDASLCLVRAEETATEECPLTQVDLLRAKASVNFHEGSLQDAVKSYDKALQVLATMEPLSFVDSLERFTSDEEVLVARTASLTIAAESSSSQGSKGRKPRAKGSKAIVPTKKATKPTKTSKAVNATHVQKMTAGNGVANNPEPVPYLVSKLERDILLHKTVVTLCLGTKDAAVTALQQISAKTGATPLQRRVRFQELMLKATEALQSDISYNVLPESTLAFPALVRHGRRHSEHDVLRSSLFVLPSKGRDNEVAKKKPASGKRQAANGLIDFLLAARACLQEGHGASLSCSSTSETYLECSMLSSVSMLLAATGLNDAQANLHPVREALHLERSRINALERESRAMSLDFPSTAPFAWPETTSSTLPNSLCATSFQEQYIDILPRPWLAVSLSLNEDGSELYVARYRSGQSPFIVKLPFSRHKQDDEDEEAFDYHVGKGELQEIIETSNYSCHNTGNMEAKAAKSNWWSEREALDKRLHELLINIENIWFGGFKGIFSQHVRQPELLARFGKSLSEILARYLPTRHASKGRAKSLALDDKVLELFIGLGDDQDGVVDLDEPLADLLYFVVDVLQFNGEQNAYDEIDFDSMAVDVLDALRSYHETAVDDDTSHKHLILILDKRLQAFPWESLPYLEKASVSRVGSMLSLRQRILAMGHCPAAHQEEGRYTIGRKSGTYILNPSKDLKSTQASLSAPLDRLPSADGAKWASIVQQAPSEDEFRTALTDSSMLLYFGHGSGAQYIRPRTIRKLDRCSKVVWLMGCSSGAVTEHGELEPSAVPLAYLMAGNKDSLSDLGTSENTSQPSAPACNEDAGRCMAVLATLWDVTDKDIDRFSLAVGEEWGLWPGAASEAPKLPTRTPKKRARPEAPSTPQQVPKTPKTPKARKTPGPVGKTPARSRSRPNREVERARSLVEAVTRSRDACYLRYLNGAAPVVYGVPVYLGE
ncbi:hypothetical protein B0A50_07347 [Salinomyces thailandicus]|uniref:separase n=1 Tax=Salinomyces thailandicus TaxID=706561 RepID=A0A4U0TMU0_9PEZI|nr:hypothetical protein B0A50_07347 [Salinomyces thailandica]